MFLGALIARDIGGKRNAQILTAFAVFIVPMSLFGAFLWVSFLRNGQARSAPAHTQVMQGTSEGARTHFIFEEDLKKCNFSQTWCDLLST